jgi:hypothetical protein
MAVSTGAPICELESISLVLAGSFNPSILQPQWFARHGLVGEAEANAAAIEIIRPEIVSLRLGPFLISATHEKASFETASVAFAQLLRDLVVGTFGILAETPIVGIGINRTMHFKMFDADAWHRVGHALVPKEPWKGAIDNAGTLSVTLRGARPGRRDAVLHVTVEPSLRVPTGVFFTFNEHASVSTAEDAIKVIDAHHRAVWDHAHKSALKILELGMPQ